MPTQSTPLTLPVPVSEYMEALHASLVGTSTQKNGYGFTIQKKQRYYKVIMTINGREENVHAFIDVATLGLIKAAGWTSPQRNSDKTLAVRYQLDDVQDRMELCERLRTDPQAFTGGYLYQR